MNIDPHVIAELTGDEFENPTNDLDDDFVLQASGGELPALPPPISLSLRKNEFREKPIYDDDDNDEGLELGIPLIIILKEMVSSSFFAFLLKLCTAGDYFPRKKGLGRIIFM